jgi:hypothetical protein
MVTPFIAVRLVAATVLLGGVALAGSAIAKPGAGEATLASAAPVSSSVPAAVAVTAPVVMAEPASPCGRKVKVVYAGYGEAERAGCSLSAKSAAN